MTIYDCYILYTLRQLDSNCLVLGKKPTTFWDVKQLLLFKLLEQKLPVKTLWFSSFCYVTSYRNMSDLK